MLDPRSVGRRATVFVEITLNSQADEVLEAFEAGVARIPDVLECHLMAGAADYILKVVAEDTDDFGRIHRQHLARLPGVAQMQSSFALRTVFKSTSLRCRRTLVRGETVILFHGLGRTPASMALLARQLEAKGWRTERPRYPSTDLSLEQAVAHVAGFVAARRRAKRVHLAGHSLGGLLAFLIAGRLAARETGTRGADRIAQYRLGRGVAGGGDPRRVLG